MKHEKVERITEQSSENTNCQKSLDTNHSFKIFQLIINSALKCL